MKPEQITKENIRLSAIHSVEKVDDGGYLWSIHTNISVEKNEEGEFVVTGLSKEQVVEIIYEGMLNFYEQSGTFDNQWKGG